MTDIISTKKYLGKPVYKLQGFTGNYGFSKEGELIQLIKYSIPPTYREIAESGFSVYDYFSLDIEEFKNDIPSKKHNKSKISTYYSETHRREKSKTKKNHSKIKSHLKYKNKKRKYKVSYKKERLKKITMDGSDILLNYVDICPNILELDKFYKFYKNEIYKQFDINICKGHKCKFNNRYYYNYCDDYYESLELYYFHFLNKGEKCTDFRDYDKANFNAEYKDGLCMIDRYIEYESFIDYPYTLKNFSYYNKCYALGDNYLMYKIFCKWHSFIDNKKYKSSGEYETIIDLLNYIEYYKYHKCFYIDYSCGCS